MIWLIGNNGMLGHDVESLLKKESLDYFATDIEVDITNLYALKSYYRDKQYKYIINCAGYTDVDGAETEQDKAFFVNAQAVKNLASAAKDKNAVLIHVSTDHVFDGNKKEPYLEEDKVNPLSIYAKSKLRGEEYIQDVLDKFFIIRTAWLYGKNGKNFVDTMLRLFQEKDEIEVVNDQYGSPTYTLDLAAAIIKIIKSNLPLYGIYHFTNEGYVNWHEFSGKIYDLAKSIGLCNKEIIIQPITTEEYPRPAARPQFLLLSKEKIKKIFDINPRPWQEALEEFIKNL